MGGMSGSPVTSARGAALAVVSTSNYKQVVSMTKWILIHEALTALSKRRTTHPIDRYIDAFRETGWLVVPIAAGGDSIVFRLPNGNILHITNKILTQELGTRPFDLPILHRGFIPSPGGLKVFYFVQPEAQTPVSETAMRQFERQIQQSGWLLSDCNQHQLGIYSGETKLLDPFAVERMPFWRKD
jgi:hypothetical protein